MLALMCVQKRFCKDALTEECLNHLIASSKCVNSVVVVDRINHILRGFLGNIELREK